jgi:hypothetical protein
MIPAADSSRRNTPEYVKCPRFRATHDERKPDSFSRCVVTLFNDDEVLVAINTD